MSQTCDCAPVPAQRKGLSRRGFLGAAAGASALVAASAVSPKLAFAAEGPAYTGDTLVVLSQRGAADWLSILAPIGDPGYAAARPTIAVPGSAALQLDSMFGLHPAMAPLLPLYQSGQLAFVHAVGNPDATRSHFDATRLQELAGDTTSGWLERAAAATPETGPLQSVHLGTASVPQAQFGPRGTTAMTSLNGFRLWYPKVQGYNDTTSTLRTLWSGSHDAAGDAARDMLGSLGTVADISRQPSTAAYPSSATAHALQDVARLVRAGVGLQVASVDSGGWDMHTNLGTPTSGTMFTKAGELAAAVAAFAADLGPLMSRVTLVTLTEFGRRVAQNVTGGLDHGHGYGVMVLGGNVNGGQVFGSWPGLAAAQLDNGDLAATTDYRTVLGEILATRCSVSADQVFPGLPAGSLGIVR